MMTLPVERNRRIVFVICRIDTPRTKLSPKTVEILDFFPRSIGGSKKRAWDKMEGKGTLAVGD